MIKITKMEKTNTTQLTKNSDSSSLQKASYLFDSLELEAKFTNLILNDLQFFVFIQFLV